MATSSLTLTEVLPLPLERQAHDLAKTYREILLNTPYVHLLPVDVALAEEAARLRAAYRLKTPDAIQVAASIQAGCDAFLTNDGGPQTSQGHLCVGAIRARALSRVDASVGSCLTIEGSRDTLSVALDYPDDRFHL